MNNFLVSIVLFVILFFSVQGGLIVHGDNDNGFNMVKHDRILFNFTEMYPDLTVGLNFTTISEHAQDAGFGSALTTNGDLYTWGSNIA
eukprot:gene7663-11983_t